MVKTYEPKAAVAAAAVGIATFWVLYRRRGKFHIYQVVGGGAVGGATLIILKV